jgi:hypothetical protein
MPRARVLSSAMRRGVSRWFWAAIFGGATITTLTAVRDASAFCRSTTCDSRSETCEKDDNGCPRTGAPLSWRALPLTYRFYAGGSDKLDRDESRESVRRAFQAWSNVSCDDGRTSLRFEEGKEIPGDHPLAGDEIAKASFGIYYRDEAWPYDDNNESLALTNQTFGKLSGFIDYSAIEVNTSTTEFRLRDDQKGIDFESVMIHEVGHYIGLAHSEVPSSIMVASYCQSADRCGGGTDQARALSDDDIAAVCALYPPSGIAGLAPADPSSSSCAVAKSTPARTTTRLSPPMVTGTFAMLGALFFIRRRKSR